MTASTLRSPQGQIHGLVGPNGAGKTTLLGLILGLTEADSGNLRSLAVPYVGRSRVPDGVAGFVDGPGLYPSLSARQNLAALARLRGDGAEDIADVLAEVGLADMADDRVRGFSLGMRQRLGLAAALLTRPRLLVLDEPANGLDPAGTRHVHRVLTRLAADGTSVVLSSHRMDELAALCSDVTLLATGRVVFSGPVRDLVVDSDELDYRLRTSDPVAARAVAVQAAPDLHVLVPDGLSPRPHDETLTVRATVPVLDELVAASRAGVAVRELAPVVAPLEAAFLALTTRGPATTTTTNTKTRARRHGRDRMTGAVLTPPTQPRAAAAGRAACRLSCYRFEIVKLLAQWRIRSRSRLLARPGRARRRDQPAELASRLTRSLAGGWARPGGRGPWSSFPSPAAGCCHC